MATPSKHILPIFQIGSEYTYQDLTLPEAQRMLLRVHRVAGAAGSLLPEGPYGFVAPQQASMARDKIAKLVANINRKELVLQALPHIRQWKDGTWPLETTPFLSASFSIIYALNEAFRWNARFPDSNTHISVIDASKLSDTAWLGIELIGAAGGDAANFARWSHEVLIPYCIPRDAIVFTAPVDVFCSLLPPWCESAIENSKRRGKTSPTESAVWDFRRLAPRGYSTQAAQNARIDQVLARSIELHLGGSRSSNRLPVELPVDAVQTIARFASMFCWWPKWIIGRDPSEYDALYESVLRRLQAKLLAMGVKLLKAKVEAEQESFNLLSTPKKGASGPQRRQHAKQTPDYLTNRVKREW